MTKEKQIEEMAKITCQMHRREKEKKCAGVQECDCKCLQYNRCEALYNLGYRKASDVAREIMQEVRQALLNMILKNAMGENYDIENRFAEIEKKFTESEDTK